MRNVKPLWSKFGAAIGVPCGGLDMIANEWFGLSLFGTVKHGKPDCDTLKPLAAVKPIVYPKPDGKVSFDKPSSVFLSNTNHEEDQPVHLRLRDPAVPIRDNLPRYGEPARLYCPAGVYEVVYGDEAKRPDPRFVINAQNCVHCKTCDIKDPAQNIDWTTPEGGGGPNYPGHVSGAEARPETATFADEAFSCKNVVSASGRRPRPAALHKGNTAPCQIFSRRLAPARRCSAHGSPPAARSSAFAAAHADPPPRPTFRRSRSAAASLAIISPRWSPAPIATPTPPPSIRARRCAAIRATLDLTERAFAAALADGDVADGFPLAERLVARDPANSLARLALGARAIGDGQYVAARAQLAAGDAGKAHDVTTTLLTAWSYAGVGDQRRALDTLDRIREPSLAVFRDYHAGLIADAARQRLRSRSAGSRRPTTPTRTLCVSSTSTPASSSATARSTRRRRSSPISAS